VKGGEKKERKEKGNNSLKELLCRPAAICTGGTGRTDWMQGRGEFLRPAGPQVSGRATHGLSIRS